MKPMGRIFGDAALYAAYNIGRAKQRRDGWMADARVAARSHESCDVVRLYVRYARRANRDLLINHATWRMVRP